MFGKEKVKIGILDWNLLFLFHFLILTPKMWLSKTDLEVPWFSIFSIWRGLRIYYKRVHFCNGLLFSLDLADCCDLLVSSDFYMFTHISILIYKLKWVKFSLFWLLISMLYQSYFDFNWLFFVKCYLTVGKISFQICHKKYTADCEKFFILYQMFND